jgi:hypothetical protein
VRSVVCYLVVFFCSTVLFLLTSYCTGFTILAYILSTKREPNVTTLPLAYDK